MSASVTFASVSACCSTSRMCARWCTAVSFGRKPVPGGVMNVRRGLDRMLPSLSTTPMPILFALPSMPSASIRFAGVSLDIAVLLILILKPPPIIAPPLRT